MANPSLRDYKGQLRGGIQYSNRYQIFIDGMPAGVEYYTINAQLPAATMNHVSSYYQSRELKWHGTIRWQSWNITLYANINENNGLEAYSEFWRWANQQQGFYSNIGTNIPSEYWRNVRIIPLGNDGSTEMGEFVLLDAFVTEIQPVDLSWESEDLMRFNVVIQFSEATWTSGGEVIFGDNEGA